MTSLGETSEARGGSLYLQKSWNVPAYDIFEENESSSVAGNFYYSRPIIEKNNISHISIIGSDFMKSRIELLSRKIFPRLWEWDIVGVPYKSLQLAMRDFVIYAMNRVVLVGVDDGDDEKAARRLEMPHNKL